MTLADTHHVSFYDAMTDTHYQLFVGARDRFYTEAPNGEHRGQQRTFSCESLTFYIACTPMQNEVLHFSFHILPTTSFSQLTTEPTTQATHYILLPHQEQVFTFLEDRIHTNAQANRALPYEITHNDVTRLMSHIDTARTAYLLTPFSGTPYSENAPEAGCNPREHAAIATAISWALAGMAFGPHAVPAFAALGFCLGHLAFGGDEEALSPPVSAYRLSTVGIPVPAEEENMPLSPS